jgi:hypothetical protein
MSPILFYLGLFFFVTALAVFIWLCGENAPFPFNLLAKLVSAIAHGIGSLFESILPAAAVDRTKGAWNYLMYKANPFMQFGYLLIMWGGLILFIIYSKSFTPSLHPEKLFLYFLFILCMIACVFATSTSPGYAVKTVSPSNELYEYDQTLYQPNTSCPTCEFAKPARSKHCSLCDHCVLKMDHHCIWINNCVGYYNYRYFLLFLVTHLIFTAYGAYLCASLLLRTLDENKLWSAKYLDSNTGTYKQADNFFLFQYITYYYSTIWALLLLCALLCLVLIGFLGFHCYIISLNQTTNERAKWGLIQKGFDIHSHHKLLNIQMKLAELNRFLEPIQRKILLLQPHLAKQHPQRSTKLTGHTFPEARTQSSSDSKDAKRVLSKEENKELNEFFTVQERTIGEIKQLLEQQKTIEEEEEYLYKHGKPQEKRENTTAAAAAAAAVAPPLPPRRHHMYNQGFVQNWREVLWPHAAAQALLKSKQRNPNSLATSKAKKA